MGSEPYVCRRGASLFWVRHVCRNETRGAETTIRKKRKKMRGGTPKADLSSNDDDNVALERLGQSRVTDELRSSHLRNAANATVGSVVTVRVKNHWWPMIFHRLRSMTWKSRGLERETERNLSLLSLHIFENKHVERTSPRRYVRYRSITRATRFEVIRLAITIGQPPMLLRGYTARKYLQVHLRRRAIVIAIVVSASVYSTCVQCWLQSHKCRLKEPANNIIRGTLCSKSACFVTPACPPLDTKRLSSIKLV